MTTADPVALARDLMRCPSVTPAEGGALAYLSDVLKRAGFTVHRMTFSEPGTRRRRESLRPHRHRRAAPDVRRPHRRGAARRRSAWSHPPFAGDIADGVLYGRGAVDMKGAHRLRGRGGARSSRRERRQAEGLDLVPDHRRRGRRRGQRHRQAAAMGGGARREIRPLHPRRAEQRRRARRHHQDRPARLAERRAGRHRQAGPRRLSAPRRQSGARPGQADERADGRAARPGQRAISIRRTSSSPRSTSATRRSISFPARRARASTSASTTATTTRRCKALVEQRAAAGAPATVQLARSTGSRRTPTCSDTEPGPFTDVVVGAIAEVTGRDAEAVDLRRHLGRALHQGLLPGGGVRPGRHDHARDRRARAVADLRR